MPLRSGCRPKPGSCAACALTSAVVRCMPRAAIGPVSALSQPLRHPGWVTNNLRPCEMHFLVGHVCHVDTHREVSCCKRSFAYPTAITRANTTMQLSKVSAAHAARQHATCAGLHDFPVLQTNVGARAAAGRFARGPARGVRAVVRPQATAQVAGISSLTSTASRTSTSPC